MPLEDIFGDLVNVGADGRGWRSIWAIMGLALGVLIGGYIGYQTSLWSALGGVAIGGVVGWVLGVALKGLFRIIALMIVFGAIVAAWYWITGRFG